MNFNLYLEDELSQQLQALSRTEDSPALFNLDNLLTNYITLNQLKPRQ